MSIEKLPWENRLEFFYEPCKSKAELTLHMKAFLGIDFPDKILDEDSTSTPINFVWSVYKTMMTGKGATRHVVAASRGSSKCLAKGTLVATPLGPVPIEDIRVGDTVYSEHGKPIKVVATHDQGVQECVNLVNHGKVWATCTPNHRWQGFEIRKPYKYRIVTPEKFYNGIKVRRLRLNQPLGDIDEPYAYALGACLGDGCSRDWGLRISSKNELIPNRVAEVLGSKASKKSFKNYSWTIIAPKHGTKWVWSDHYENWIRNKYAHEKWVDINIIKRWNRKSLLAFLAGLIDTDGSVFSNGKQNIISFGCQSKSIVEAVQYAFWALWGKDLTIRVSNQPHYKNGQVYSIALKDISTFKTALKELDQFLVTLSKKWKEEYENAKPRNYKDDGIGFRVVPAGKHHCYDITVDSDSSLYCLQNGLVTHNTMSAALVRFYGMVHFRRDGTHLAATEDQSKSANMYLDRWLALDEVKPFVAESNTKTRRLSGLPPNAHTQKQTAILRVAVATLAGVNSQRGSLNTRDELDLVPPNILSEAALVSEPTQDEHQFEPIILSLSSRKSNTGPIQKLLDDAESGKASERLMIHKWSLVDWMRKCPQEVHRPDLPMVDAFINLDSLKVTWGVENYEVMGTTEQHAQKQIKAFQGCRDCPAFIVCQARSQKQTSSSKYLRSISFVEDLLAETGESDKIIAQVLNYKPESSATVFRMFSKTRHYRKPIDAWVWLFGYPFNPNKFSEEEYKYHASSEDAFDLIKITPTKSDFYRQLNQDGWVIHYGVDWGYSPDPAVCLVSAYHKKTRRAFFFHLIHALEHSNEDWAKHIGNVVAPKYPCDMVCPDMADKASPVYFRRLRPSLPCRDKKPMRIETGVSQIRSLLWSVPDQVEKMIILDDDDTDNEMSWMAECFTKWTYKKTAMGYQIGKFDTDSEWTHPIDSARYALDPFIDTQDINIRISQPKTRDQLIKDAGEGSHEAAKQLSSESIQDVRQAMEYHLAEQFGISGVFRNEDVLRDSIRTEGDVVDPNDPPPPKKSGLKFKF